jgi:hypothetical protein
MRGCAARESPAALTQYSVAEFPMNGTVADMLQRRYALARAELSFYSTCRDWLTHLWVMRGEIPHL